MKHLTYLLPALLLLSACGNSHRRWEYVDDIDSDSVWIDTIALWEESPAATPSEAVAVETIYVSEPIIEQAMPAPAIQQRRPEPKKPETPFDLGYEAGYEAGIEDGSEADDSQGSYDDSSTFRGQARRDYIRGYAEGYEDGFEEGYDDYREAHGGGDEWE